MSGPRSAESKCDISQDTILKRFADYLKQQNRSEKTIDLTQNVGWCVGFTILAVYAKWLELTQPICYDQHGQAISRDDWPWLEALLKKLSRWNPQQVSLNSANKSKKKLAKQIDRLIALTNFFQYGLPFSSILLLDFLAKLQDTAGRKFLKEYTISGLFNAKEIYQKIKLPGQSIETTFLNEVIQEDRMVFMWTADHLLGVIKHKNIFYYYDSNAAEGWVEYPENEASKFILDFFKESEFDISEGYGLGFCVIACTNQQPAIYPTQATLLSALKQPVRLAGKEKTHMTALQLAAENKCDACLVYYGQHPPIEFNKYVKVKDADNHLALYSAVAARYTFGIDYLFNENLEKLYSEEEKWWALKKAVDLDDVEVAIKLLQFRINLNLQVENEQILLIAALRNKSVIMISLLLSYGADPNLKTHEGWNSWHYATELGFSAGVELLLQCADVNLTNQEDISALGVALIRNHRLIVDILFACPAIKVTKFEYQYLFHKHKKDNRNKKIQHWFHLAQTKLLLQQIEIQMQIIEKYHPIYFAREVAPVFSKAKEFLNNNPTMQAREKSLWLLYIIQPIFQREIPRRKTPAIWQPMLHIANPINRLMQKFDISIIDINNCCLPGRNVYRI